VHSQSLIWTSNERMYERVCSLQNRSIGGTSDSSIDCARFGLGTMETMGTGVIFAVVAVDGHIRRFGQRVIQLSRVLFLHRCMKYQGSELVKNAIFVLII